MCRRKHVHAHAQNTVHVCPMLKYRSICTGTGKDPNIHELDLDVIGGHWVKPMEGVAVGFGTSFWGVKERYNFFDRKK